MVSVLQNVFNKDSPQTLFELLLSVHELTRLNAAYLQKIFVNT